MLWGGGRASHAIEWNQVWWTDSPTSIMTCDSLLVELKDSAQLTFLEWRWFLTRAACWWWCMMLLVVIPAIGGGASLTRMSDPTTLSKGSITIMTASQQEGEQYPPKYSKTHINVHDKLQHRRMVAAVLLLVVDFFTRRRKTTFFCCLVHHAKNNDF